jgi:hypothetical protein
MMIGKLKRRMIKEKSWYKSKGYMQLFKNNKLISSFDISNLECNDFALINSNLYISTSKGLINCDINNEISKRKKGIFELMSINVSNQNFPLNKKLQLNHTQNNLTINFAILDFGIKSIENVYYQVNNSEWKLIDPQVRTLYFPALASGEYIIRFKGIINGKTENLKSIYFQISDPFWLTNWFFALLFISVLGLLLAVFSILTIIRQVTDGLQIKDQIITFRHNLKQTIIPLSGNLKIKMKTEVMKIRRVGTLGSDFIIVTHFLQDHNTETPILKFQMDNSNADNAKKLGNELTRIMNAKFRQ